MLPTSNDVLHGISETASPPANQQSKSIHNKHHVTCGNESFVFQLQVNATSIHIHHFTPIQTNPLEKIVNRHAWHSKCRCFIQLLTLLVGCWWLMMMTMMTEFEWNEWSLCGVVTNLNKTTERRETQPKPKT